MNEATKQAILSAVRSVLIVVGSSLTAHGVMNQEMVHEVIGAVMAMVPILWGVYDKYSAEAKTAEREVVAVNAGIAVSNASPVNIAPVGPTEASEVIAQFGSTK